MCEEYDPTKVEIIQVPWVSIFEFGPLPSLDVIGAEIWPGEIIPTGVPQCATIISQRETTQRTRNWFFCRDLSSSCVTDKYVFFSLERKDEKCKFNVCVELFRELEFAQLNQVRRGHGVLDVILEEIWAGGWAGDTQDI